MMLVQPRLRSLMFVVGPAIASFIFTPDLGLAQSADQSAQKNRDMVRNEGATLFAVRCAHCHGSGVIEPNIAGISKLHAENIYHALWSGVMREAANGLDDAQRWAIAQFVASLQPDKPAAEFSNFCNTSGSPSSGKTSQSWAGWAPDPGNSRYLPGLSINESRLRRARLKWAFVFPDIGSTTNAGNQATVVNGRLYIGHRNRFVHSLDANTGCIHWIFQADAGVRSAIVIADDLALFADYENYVYALDAASGVLNWRTRADEQPSARVNGNVVVHDRIVYVPISSNQEFVNALDPSIPCCSFRGSIAAYDIQTGERLWKTTTIDQPLMTLGKNSKGTMRYGPSGGAVWSLPTVDGKRGLLYVGTSNQYTGPVVEESDAVIAFDLKTGEKKWIRNFAPERFGGEDIWHGGCVGLLADPEGECPEDNPSGEGDRDIGSPVVLQTREDGSDVILVGSKDGVLFALDPDRRGEILWQSRIGKIMKVQGPSFGGIEHGFSADQEKAYVPIADIDVLEEVSAGALVAVDLLTGQIAWRIDAAEDWCDGKPDRCSNAMTAPTTVTQTIVFAAANDGVIRAFDTDQGRVVWSYDTVAPIAGVNGLEGSGGSITRSGPTVVDGMFYQTSGYGQGLGMPGNVLYAFEIPAE